MIGTYVNSVRFEPRDADLLVIVPAGISLPRELPPGGTWGGHRHAGDHWMVVHKGPLVVKVEREDGTRIDYVLHAPCMLLAEARSRHEVIAGNDGGKWECFFTNDQLVLVDGDYKERP